MRKRELISGSPHLPPTLRRRTISEFSSPAATSLRNWVPLQFSLTMQPTCFGNARCHVAASSSVIDEFEEGTVSMPSFAGVVSGKVPGPW